AWTDGGRARNLRSPTCSWPATGRQPVGPPRWRAPSAAATWPRKRCCAGWGEPSGCFNRTWDSIGDRSESRPRLGRQVNIRGDANDVSQRHEAEGAAIPRVVPVVPQDKTSAVGNRSRFVFDGRLGTEHHTVAAAGVVLIK